MAITLKAARVNAGLTQPEAAKLLGISIDSLRNYEHGKTFPTVPLIQKIERVYGLPYSDILFLPPSTV